MEEEGLALFFQGDPIDEEEFKEKAWELLSNMDSMRAIKEEMANTILQMANIESNVQHPPDEDWLQQVIQTMWHICHQEPQQQGEEEEEEEQEAAAAEPAEKKHKKKTKKDFEVEPFLESLLRQCPQQQHHHQQEDEVEDEGGETLRTVLSLDAKLDASTNKVVRKNLLRGFCIEVWIQLCGFTLGKIEGLLNLKSAKPSSNSSIRNPRIFYNLVAETGMHKLRFLQLRDDTTLAAICKHRTDIDAFFAEHPDQLDQWQDQNDMPAEATITIDGEQHNWSIDYKWLLQ